MLEYHWNIHVLQNVERTEEGRKRRKQSRRESSSFFKLFNVLWSGSIKAPLLLFLLLLFPFSSFLSLFFSFMIIIPTFSEELFMSYFSTAAAATTAVCVCVNVHLDMSLSLSIRSWFLLTLRFRLTSSVVDISLELKEKNEDEEEKYSRQLEMLWIFFYDESFFISFQWWEMKGRFLDCNLKWKEGNWSWKKKLRFSCGVYAAVNFIRNFSLKFFHKQNNDAILRSFN